MGMQTITFLELLEKFKRGEAPKAVYYRDKKYMAGVVDFRRESDCVYLSSAITNDMTVRGMADDRVIEYSDSILDSTEKRYLEAALKPFRSMTLQIQKRVTSMFGYFIEVEIEELEDCMVFPCFSDENMYANMQIDKQYTKESLGLWADK